ncbi:hypothetical protein RhiirB3_386814 [Rhizophagus irregularis]|nr:hypothetical protein RhiirB3_386814 [Rhizophagus irregularis]
MIHQFSCPKKIDIKVDNDNNPWMKEIMKAFKKEEARMEKERQNETLPEISWNLSVEKIDTFFERQDIREYKFDIDSRGNVFIVELKKVEHAFVIARFKNYFDVPNRDVANNPPIDVAGALNKIFLWWNFSTHNYYTGAPTTCTGPGLLNYQVNIPTQDVFWDSFVIRGASSTVGYAITVPGEVTAPNFIIDLYQIQQLVLLNQEN